MNRKNKTRRIPAKGDISKKKTGVSLEQEIITFFNKGLGKKFSAQQVHRAFMAKDKKGKKYISKTLDRLVSEGKFVLDGKKYKVGVAQGTLVGIVDYVNPRYGFVMVEGLEKDIKVSSQNMKNALHGDKVSVSVRSGNGSKSEGVVMGVLEPSKRIFVGRIEISPRFAFVIPQNAKMHQDIFVNSKNLKRAKHGDRVIVEIREWRENDKNPIGVITKVLGKAGENDTEIHSIMFEYDLPFEFPEKIEEAANKISTEITKAEIAKRRDFRDVTTFTIDPLSAKDFDDAISVKKLPNNEWEIGVHIADVTHYVQPNTELEEETQKRATSVYLVDRTVPMLPENLSNGLCSLRPKEEKLTFSAVFTLDENGTVSKEWFGRTVIYSDRRFTYEEAQEVIETQKGDYVEELLVLNKIAKNLKAKRFEKGAISFETTEFYFLLDETGKPVELRTKVRKDAHKLVEEFMLLANRKVATFVYNQKVKDQTKTMVYRIHEDPDPEKVTVFANFVKRFGYEISTKPETLAHEINRITKEVEGRPEANAIETQAIRTMSKAKYGIDPLGHYGLAFDHYSHFTSPIRRYPDMMVHRLLQHYLNKGKSADANEYAQKCVHSSEMEKRAAQAERASIKYKQVEFMSNYLEEEMEGVITGLTEWGIFVEIQSTKCEGMVRMSSMDDDYYDYDAEKQRVIGRRHGTTYEFGNKVTVRVTRTDLEKRTIDLEMV